MEKEQVIMEQALAAQDEITGQYSETANHCGSTPVKMAFLNLLGEEHRIQCKMKVNSKWMRRGVAALAALTVISALAGCSKGGQESGSKDSNVLNIGGYDVSAEEYNWKGLFNLLPHGALEQLDRPEGFQGEHPRGGPRGGQKAGRGRTG